MSGAACRGAPVGESEDLQRYLDELLAPAKEEPADGVERGYWLVSAAGVRLAVPEADAVPCEAHESHEDGAVVIDVARIVAGRQGGNGCRLHLPAHPGHRLAVDEVGERIGCADADIRWRDASAVRPWLAGMMTTPAAAVISVAALIEACAREAGEGRGE